jgi:hypothetical protein
VHLLVAIRNQRRSIKGVSDDYQKKDNPFDEDQEAEGRKKIHQRPGREKQLDPPNQRRTDRLWRDVGEGHLGASEEWFRRGADSGVERRAS